MRKVLFLFDSKHDLTSTENPLENQKPITEEQREFILRGVKFLESPSLLMKLTDMVGKPIELAYERLPQKYQANVQTAVSKSLTKALEAAIATVPKPTAEKVDWLSVQASIQTKSYLHIAATTATGALGGFFGIVGLAVELPITTTIMLRSISEIAQSYGVDLSKMENRLECLYVFTLGSKGKFDNSMDSSYLTSRIAFAQSIRAAAEFMTVYSAREVLKAIEKGTAPQVLQFISRVATYFEVAVTEKMLAEAVPVVGAVGGAAINAGFTDFFNDAAKYHFGMKLIEAEYGEEVFRAEYQRALKILKGQSAA